MKVIHPTSYEELRSSGSTVPKDKNYYYFNSGFKVGGESNVTNGQLNCPAIRVRCTQNNPFHLVEVNQMPKYGQSFTAETQFGTDNFKLIAINLVEDDFRKYKIENLKTKSVSDVDTDWFNLQLTGRKITIKP